MKNARIAVGILIGTVASGGFITLLLGSVPGKPAFNGGRGDPLALFTMLDFFLFFVAFLLLESAQ